jgi:hypothetical protein
LRKKKCYILKKSSKLVEWEHGEHREHREQGNTLCLLVEKPERKSPLERARIRWKDTIKVVLKE